MDSQFDIFGIGGGINGVSIARDAAGRGYSVALAEMNDLATKLGLKIPGSNSARLEGYMADRLHELSTATIASNGLGV